MGSDIETWRGDRPDMGGHIGTAIKDRNKNSTYNGRTSKWRCWLLAIGSIPTDVGYCRRCWLLPLVLMLLAVVGVVADVDAPLLSRGAT